MRYAYTCQCTHPQTGKTGCWLYMGDDHKTGATLSPVFSDLYNLYEWMRANGWESIPGGIWTARKVDPARTFDNSASVDYAPETPVNGIIPWPY